VLHLFYFCTFLILESVPPKIYSKKTQKEKPWVSLDNTVVIEKVNRLKKLDGSRLSEGSFNILLFF
jgi:hypothetical protein